MTKKDKEYILAIVDNEGFDYTFRYYSNFEGVNEIKDKKFHQLRLAYREAAEALAKYIGLED